MKNKIVIITGPTASGKTELSINLANKFNGEVVSADSKQVYKGLDVGTDKIELDEDNEHAGVKHHLINIASPKRAFTVVQWKKHAEQAIQKILKQNKLPLIAGGTAFYIEALIRNYQFPKVKPKQTLRRGFDRLTTKQLFKNLKNIDPERAKEIDPNNRVRIIRALEIAVALGKVPKLKSRPKYDALVLGVKRPDSKLKKLINKRVEERADAIIEEIKKLRGIGLSFNRLINFGMEYKYYSLHLQGKISKAEAVRKSKTATWQFAKRQYTFLKRLPVTWTKSQQEAETKIRAFLA